MLRKEALGEVIKFRLARSLLGRGLYFTACYLVDGLMIDAGCAHTVGELLRALEPYRVLQVVNTHSHEDHIGANAAVQARYGARILAHAEALEKLSEPETRREMHMYRRVMWGTAKPSTAHPLGSSVETPAHRFEVIHTPGHSPDHICLYEPNKGWLFTGDAYIGGKDRGLRRDYNIWQMISSLRKIAELDIELLFSGSGSVRRRPKEDLLRKIRYLEDTGSRILALHQRGLGYREIRRRVFGREFLLAYLTMGHFSGRNLVRSYVVDRPSF